MSIYANMKFPDYQYQEYPKMVYPNGISDKRGKPMKGVLVRDESEERTALGGEAVVREEDERTRLVKLCEVNGVQFDKRWGVERLKGVLDGAGHDSSKNPFA